MKKIFIDNFDPIKVENQILGFMDMTTEEIYSYYQTPSIDKSIASLEIFTKSALKTLKSQKKQVDLKNKYYIDYILKSKEDIIKSNKGNSMDFVYRELQSIIEDSRRDNYSLDSAYITLKDLLNGKE